MNPTYTLDPLSHRILLQYGGAASFEQWAAALEAALADANNSSGVDLLVDRRGITAVPTTQTLYRTVEFFERHSPQLRRVASVVEGDAVYGMCRMLEVLAQRTAVQFRAFRDYGEASRWLAAGPE